MPDYPAAKRRWFYLTPDRFVAGLLLAVCFLWTSERFRWFAFNHHKGWTVLIAVVAVAVAMVSMSIWFLASLLFRLRTSFRIRTGLALTVACSMALGWLTPAMRQARHQAEVVAWLKTAQPKYEIYSHEPLVPFETAADWLAYRSGQPQNKSAAEPGWLRNLMGEDFFQDVVEVSLWNKWAGDDSVVRIGALTHLRKVGLYSDGLSDRSMSTLRNLVYVEDLEISSANITDAGIKEIERLPRLRSLELDCTALTDAGLRDIASLAGLESPTIVDAHVTDAAMEPIGRLGRLEHLELRGTRVTDAGLNRIAGLRELAYLGLGQTMVTDAGLNEAVRSFSRLTQIFVHRTRVTAAGLECLRDRQQIELVGLDASQFTEASIPVLAGLRKLQEFWINDPADGTWTEEKMDTVDRDFPNCSVTFF